LTWLGLTAPTSWSSLRENRALILRSAPAAPAPLDYTSSPRRHGCDRFEHSVNDMDSKSTRNRLLSMNAALFRCATPPLALSCCGSVLIPESQHSWLPNLHATTRRGSCSNSAVR